MFTIIDVATGEAVKDGDGDPALFDTQGDAEAWAISHGYSDQDHRIDKV